MLFLASFGWSQPAWGDAADARRASLYEFYGPNTDGSMTINHYLKDYRLSIPDGVSTVRGIIAKMPGSGGNGPVNNLDAQMLDLCRALGFALLTGSPIALDNGYSPYPGVNNDNLRTILQLAARASGHPEIENVHVFWTGFSEGALDSASNALGGFERSIGFFSNKGHDDNFGSYPAGSLAVPGLYAPGTLDANSVVNPFKQQAGFQALRSQGGRIAMMADWFTVHESNGGPALEEFMFYWADQLQRLRLDPSEIPSRNASTPMALLAVPLSSGWWGQRTTYKSTGSGALGFAEAANPFLEIGDDTSFGGNKTDSSWLPNANLAFAYRAYGSGDGTDRRALNSASRSASPNLLVNGIGPVAGAPLTFKPDDAITLTTELREFTGATIALYYDGATLLGSSTDAASNFAIVVPTPHATGVRGFSVVLSDNSADPLSPAATKEVSFRAVLIRGFEPAWALTTGGDWRTSANWAEKGSVPQGAGSRAVVGPSITATPSTFTGNGTAWRLGMLTFGRDTSSTIRMVLDVSVPLIFSELNGAPATLRLHQSGGANMDINSPITLESDLRILLNKRILSGNFTLGGNVTAGNRAIMVEGQSTQADTQALVINGQISSSGEIRLRTTPQDNVADETLSNANLDLAVALNGAQAGFDGTIVFDSLSQRYKDSAILRIETNHPDALARADFLTQSEIGQTRCEIRQNTAGQPLRLGGTITFGAPSDLAVIGRPSGESTSAQITLSGTIGRSVPRESSGRLLLETIGTSGTQITEWLSQGVIDVPVRFGTSGSTIPFDFVLANTSGTQTLDSPLDEAPGATGAMRLVRSGIGGTTLVTAPMWHDGGTVVSGGNLLISCPPVAAAPEQTFKATYEFNSRILTLRRGDTTSALSIGQAVSSSRTLFPSGARIVRIIDSTRVEIDRFPGDYYTGTVGTSITASAQVAGSALGSGPVSVLSGGAFGGQGRVAGPVTFASGARLLAELPLSGRLECASTVDFSPGAKIVVTGTCTPQTTILATAGGGFTGSTPSLELPDGVQGMVTFSDGELRLRIFSRIEAWRNGFFSTPDASGSSADLADPDGDGTSNLLEYAFGGNPLLASSNVRPGCGISGDRLAVTFYRIADPALVYEVWASNDLSNWGTSPIWTGAPVTEPGPVTVTDILPASSAPKRFLRVALRQIE